MFRGVAERLLGSKVKARLLLHILGEEMLTSERELSKLIGVSHTAVNKALKDFEDLNLITPLRVGNSQVWRLNRQSYAYALLANLPSFAKKWPLRDLKEIISMAFPDMNGLMAVVLYGSIAEEHELPGSDIDLFILVADEKARASPNLSRALQLLNNHCIERYGNRVSSNIMTWAEHSAKRNAKFLENVKKGSLIKGQMDGVNYAIL